MRFEQYVEKTFGANKSLQAILGMVPVFNKKLCHYHKSPPVARKCKNANMFSSANAAK